MGVGGIGPLLHGDAAGFQTLLVPPRLDQRIAQVEVRVAGLRVVRDDVAEQRHLVPVDPCLPPRQHPQHQHHGRSQPQRAAPVSVRQLAHAVRGCADQHRQHADGRQVLEPVGRERELQVAVVHEAQHRPQRHREVHHPRQWSPPDPVPPQPQPGGQRRRGRHVRPRQRVTGVDLPQRIDHRQIGRPQQLAGVEPQRPRCDQGPLGQGVAKLQRLPRGVERQIAGGDRHRHRHERRQAQQVDPGDPPVLPPVPDQERDGQRHHHRLRQQSGGEQRQRQRVAPRAWFLHEADPDQHRAQVEQRRQDVFSLDDPGDRLHVHGVHGEHRGDHGGARHAQAFEEAPQQQAVEHVQGDVDRVVAGRLEAPELVLQPEGRIDERPVVSLVLDVRGREPDVAQAGDGVDDRLLGEDHVVPDEAAGQRRHVADGGQPSQRQGHQRVP